MGLLSSCGAGLPIANQTVDTVDTAAPVDETPTPLAEVEPTIAETEDNADVDSTEGEAAQEEAAQEEAAQEEAAQEETGPAPATSGESITFQIEPDGTEARFIVQEVLMGSDKTVVGVTSQVTGEITVDPSDPSSAQISTITINARDLSTDSSRRNRAIQRRILLTAKDEYQFITFQPTAIEGMPDVITVGESFEFMVVGDLTIVDTTRSETFQMTVTAISEQELKGLASITILHADYNLSIPNVPIVASVEDEVRLELEFTANTDE